MAYAERTDVTATRSKGEIDQMLRRAGADNILLGDGSENFFVAFEMNDRRLVFRVPTPRRDQFLLTETGKTRTASAIDNAVAQAHRQRWRALVLCIKAKLECVESEIETFDEAFLAHIVVPGAGGATTVGDHVLSDLSRSYVEGAPLPPLLPAPNNSRGSP